MKKILSAAFGLLTVLAFALPAWAADTVNFLSRTPNPDTGNDFNLVLILAVGAIALVGVLGSAILLFKKK